MHSAGSFINSPALLTCHLIDEANGPLARKLQRACYDTLPWLISISLDEEAAVQVVDFFARIVLITLGVVFMLSVMTGMAIIGYAVCRDFQPTISMVSTMRLSGMKW
jgi:hypothetical protein